MNTAIDTIRARQDAELWEQKHGGMTDAEQAAYDVEYARYYDEAKRNPVQALGDLCDISPKSEALYAARLESIVSAAFNMGYAAAMGVCIEAALRELCDEYAKAHMSGELV